MNVVTLFANSEDSEQLAKILIRAEVNFSCEVYKNAEDGEYGYLFTVSEQDDGVEE